MEKRLGKGLNALISEEVSKGNERVAKVSLKELVPNPFQPRKYFGEEKMEELINSIKEKGVIQPILVRPVGKGYEIIAGERRWRAAQALQIEEVPVIIKNDVDDASSLELSIIENIQREELNPIEEANAYRSLIGKFGFKLDMVSQVMGKDKTTISNSLRLLSLPQEIQDHVEAGDISVGHAKVLLSLASDQKRKRLAITILNKGISVREAERLAGGLGAVRRNVKRIKDPETARVEEELQHKLGTKVTIQQGKNRGRIEIQYFSNDDLSRLVNAILG
jgi:ParB family transcriptional regulator, chromosome partitioning protein